MPHESFVFHTVPKVYTFLSEGEKKGENGAHMREEYDGFRLFFRRKPFFSFC